MSSSIYIPVPVALATLCVTLWAPAAAAQQILEVDLSAGRTIIDDQWRSMGSVVLAVDRDGGGSAGETLPHLERAAVPSLDGRGNSVLMGRDSGVAGAVVNPETGCYAVLRTSSQSAR